MKTLLIIDAGLGQRAPTWRKPAGCRAPKAHLELIDNPNDAELAIVLGTALPADSALNGKNVYLGDINRAVAHPELFLGEAKDHAKPYVAPAAVAVRPPLRQKTHCRGHGLSDRRRPHLLWRQSQSKPKAKKTRLGG